MAKPKKNPKNAFAKSTKVPESKATTDAELSDADLEAAAGGKRSIQAKSNIAATHNKTADAIVQNIRG